MRVQHYSIMKSKCYSRAKGAEEKLSALKNFIEAFFEKQKNEKIEKKRREWRYSMRLSIVQRYKNGVCQKI